MGGLTLKGLPYERALLLADYMIKHNSTVRETAAAFNISKSTVHKDLTERLPKISGGLYEKCRKVLSKNKAERHLRGGLATKKKYEKMKENLRNKP